MLQPNYVCQIGDTADHFNDPYSDAWEWKYRTVGVDYVSEGRMKAVSASESKDSRLDKVLNHATRYIYVLSKSKNSNLSSLTISKKYILFFFSYDHDSSSVD